ncbi:universal stress protein [Streptomycetaceae bacterium NBC_01309]
MTAHAPHITVAVDRSRYADDALAWATGEAERLHVALRIVHAWVPMTTGTHDARLTTAQHILERAKSRAYDLAPELDVTTLAPADVTGAALAAESKHTRLLVLGSRGRGGFRGLLLGSTTLTAAATAECPVVVVRRRTSQDERQRTPDVVAGIDARESADAVLDFAFAEAAVRPGARLQLVYAQSMDASAWTGGRTPAPEEVAAGLDQALAAATAAWAAKYPQVGVIRQPVHAPPGGVLVDASARAGLTVVGRKLTGSLLGLRLGPVAHAVLMHAHGPVAVVPF